MRWHHNFTLNQKNQEKLLEYAKNRGIESLLVVHVDFEFKISSSDDKSSKLILNLLNA